MTISSILIYINRSLHHDSHAAPFSPGAGLCARLSLAVDGRRSVAPAKTDATKTATADLSEFKTVDTAITTTIKKGETLAQQQARLSRRAGRNDAARQPVRRRRRPGFARCEGRLAEKTTCILSSAARNCRTPPRLPRPTAAHKRRRGSEADDRPQEQAARDRGQTRRHRASRCTRRAADTPRRGWDTRGGNTWKKPVYKLALICIEYPDAKHNAKITNKDWTESLFSRDTYKNKNSVTGQPVYGSLDDYYQELSCDALAVEGKVFDWVEVKKNRMDYAPANGGGNRTTALFTEAMDLVLARDGADALKEYDGVFFLYAGERANVNAAICTGRIARRSGTATRVGRTSSAARAASRMDEHQRLLPRVRPHARPAGPVRPAGKARLRGRRRLVLHVESGRQRQAAALLRLVEGTTRLDQAGGHRSDRAAEADPGADRRQHEGVLQGAGEAGWQRVFPAGESQAEGLRREPARRRVCSIWRVVNDRPILVESHGIEGPSGRTFLTACRSRAAPTIRSHRTRRRQAARNSAMAAGAYHNIRRCRMDASRFTSATSMIELATRQNRDLPVRRASAEDSRGPAMDVERKTLDVKLPAVVVS